MKVGRSILIVFVALVVIVVGVVAYVLTSLDSIVEAAIEKYGSQVTQTDVRVSGVKIRLTEGSGAISGLTVGNPRGFSDPNVFSLGNISTKINIDSLTQDTIVIDEIAISAPQVFYEINKSGQSNINELKENMAGSSKKTEAKEEPAKEGEVKLIINRLVIEGGEISAKVAALDKDLSAKLPRIVLTDIGKKQGGATAAEVAEQVLGVLIAKVGPAVAQLGVDKYLGKTVDQVKEELSKKVGQDLGGAVGGSVEEATKGAEERVKKLFGK